MNYCVNCGVAYAGPATQCASCQLDPRVPEEAVDIEIARSRWRPDDPSFGYPGERIALALSVVAAVVLALILGAASLGLFIAILALLLVNLKVAHVRSRNSMILVSSRSFPAVAKVAKLAAYRLKLRCPEVYVTQAMSYNAYTQGFARHGFVVVHSELVEDFSPGELLFVIGHEFGHIKRFHTTWLTLLHPATVGGARFVLAPLMRLIFNVWSVKAEYTSDQAGLIVCGNLETACGVMLKLAGGPGVGKGLDLGQLEEGSDSGLGLGGLLEYLGDHPFAQNRILHLRSYAESRDYATACWWR